LIDKYDSFFNVGSYSLKSDKYDSLCGDCEFESILLCFFIELSLDLFDCFLDACFEAYLDGLGVLCG
jgi:hypothetical protein